MKKKVAILFCGIIIICVSILLVVAQKNKPVLEDDLVNEVVCNEYPLTEFPNIRRHDRLNDITPDEIEYFLSQEGLELYVELTYGDGWQVSLTLINNTNYSYVYGSFYGPSDGFILYKKVGDWWVPLGLNVRREPGMAFPSIGYIVDANSYVNYTLNLSHIFGNLTPGEYAITITAWQAGTYRVYGGIKVVTRFAI